MKTTKIIFFAIVLLSATTFISCKKCSECHYEDASNNKVELGEYCNEDLESVEKNGIVVDGKNVEVHCHEH